MRSAPRPVALLAALLLSACTAAADPGDPHAGHGGGGTAIPDGTREVPVRASSFAFEGTPIELTAGDDVAVGLTSSDTTHDLVVEELDFHVAAEPGQTARALLSADAPGTYAAWCSVPGHRQAGMETTITVRPS